jgi:hypothetical protein
MWKRVFFVVAVCLGLYSGTAFAASHDVSYYLNNWWDVERHTLDNGITVCSAMDYRTNSQFSVFELKDHSITLEFRLPNDWNFGANGYNGDAQMRVDKHKSWNVSNAQFFGDTVMIKIPDNIDSTKFMSQLANGKMIYLKGKNEFLGGFFMDPPGSWVVVSALNKCAKELH